MITSSHPIPLELFVYGTLREGSDSPMASWLGKQARWVGSARVRGALYLIDGYPGFVPDPQSGWVHGDLFALAPDRAESALATLDDYEECSPYFPQPWEYRREILHIEVEGRRVPAWTYVYAWPIAGLLRIGGGDFLRRKC